MQASQVRRTAVTLCAVAMIGAATSAGAVAGPAGHPAAAPPATLPTVAPYVDTSVSGGYPHVYQAINSKHLKNLTAGFVIGKGNSCVPRWGDQLPVSNDPSVSKFITTAQGDGASVIVSFGGQIDPAVGGDLAVTCTSRPKLIAAYRAVMRQFHATHLDFDVEGSDELGQPASIARRFTAIHALEAGNHKLVVSLTVAVTPAGLDAQGRALLRAAKRARARIDVLNIMAMDYGGHHEMGTAAITAAKHTLHQLRHFSPHATYRNIGVTPMIGQNDTPSEAFTIADARRLVGFARSHHVGRLAFWSIDRDSQCSTPQTAAQYNCSGVSQSSLQFTHIFVG